MAEKKRLVSLILCVFVALSSSVPSLAHSGGTDGKGGHRDASTGEYHYHHGYSAHQHTDGVCPYDYDDKTGDTSGTSGSKKPGLSLTKIEPEQKQESEPEGKKQDGVFLSVLKFVGKACAWLFIGYYVISVACMLFGGIFVAIYTAVKDFIDKAFRKK